MKGSVDINFGDGTYIGVFEVPTARWVKLDFDGDGINESDGTEARLFDGVFLTPATST